MDWDDDELPSQVEAALQAAEVAYAGRSGGAGSASPLPAQAAASQDAPTEATASEQPARPARRRQLPSALQGPPAGPGAPKAATAAVPDENLPPALFPGRLRYAFTGYEIDALCQWLLGSGVTALGFDIEWRVTYQTGVTPRPVALVQLCYTPPPSAASTARPQHLHQHECLLLHIAHTGVTPHLRSLLCSPDILKVGVGTHGDALKLQRDFGLEMQGVVCLSDFANARLVSAAPATSAGSSPADAGLAGPAQPVAAGPSAAEGGGGGQDSSGCSGVGPSARWPAAQQGPQQGPQQGQPQTKQAQQLVAAPQKWSLAALVGHLMRLHLEKSQALRCSNWEVRPPLSWEQQQYAATDAWASLRCYEILAKMLVLAPTFVAAPAGAPAGSHTSPTAAQQAVAAAAGVAGPAGALPADWVPACAVLRHLQPAKLAVYQALTQQGLSVQQVAAQRRIQEDSVQGYMAEAITAGMAYSWSSLGVPPSALQHAAEVCGELLGRQLVWQPAPAAQDAQSGLEQQHQQDEQQGQQPGQQQQHGDLPVQQQERQQLVGCKRPPPCSPRSLASAELHSGCSAAAAGAQADPAAAAAEPPSDGPGGSDTTPNGGGGAGAEPACCGQPADLLERLLAAGQKLRELKEQRFEALSYGQLRLALAHLGRCNPEPWA